MAALSRRRVVSASKSSRLLGAVVVLLLHLLSWTDNISSVEAALMVGRRRIKCVQPQNGSPQDAVMDPFPLIPSLMGYVGCQAVFPTLAKCPYSVQIQPPWFSGTEGGGLCPPEYWNLPAALPGAVIFAATAAVVSYINSNRLLVTETGFGVVPVTGTKDALEVVVNKDDLISFKDVEEWFVTPVGLVVKQKSSTGGGTSFFPTCWDANDVKALLDDRL